MYMRYRNGGVWGAWFQLADKTYVDTGVSSVAQFASGTRMAFQQTTAPTGWTKDSSTAMNDALIRLTTFPVTTGGSNGFSGFNAQNSTGSYTLQIADIPAHTHVQNAHSHTKTDPGHAHVEQAFTGGISGTNSIANDATTNLTPSAGTPGVSTASATTGISYAAATAVNQNTGGTGGHSHAFSTTIKYADFIVASKN
jgi:hypothetical protein